MKRFKITAYTINKLEGDNHVWRYFVDIEMIDGCMVEMSVENADYDRLMRFREMALKAFPSEAHLSIRRAITAVTSEEDVDGNSDMSITLEHKFDEDVDLMGDES